MTNSRLTRRSFITSSVALLALGTLTQCNNKATNKIISNQQLSQAIADVNAARRFAEIYLKSYPKETNLDRLHDTINESLARNTQTHELSDIAQIIEGLSQAIRQDYILGEVVNLDGWIISQTEARLFVIASKN